MAGGLVTTSLQVNGGSSQIILKDTTDDDDHSIVFRNNVDGDDYKITTKDFTSKLQVMDFILVQQVGTMLRW